MSENISAVLIAKNEEAVIRRCLASLKGVDEIVVLDTGSTDKTEVISASLGARTAVTEFKPFHFANARNFADSLAQGPWILTIDADEILRAGMLRKIRETIKKFPDADGFEVSFADRGIVSYKTKIYKKSSWTWKYRVHEQLTKAPSKETKNSVGIARDIFFEHLLHPDKSGRRAQNIELLHMTIQENPEYVTAYRKLGQEYMIAKNWDKAIPFLCEYLEKTADDPLERSDVMMRVAECMAQGGEMEDALKWFNQSAKCDPRRREPLYHAGWWLMKTAKTVPDLERAIEYLSACVAIPPDNRPNSNLDNNAVWGGEPVRMIRFCEAQIKACQ